MSSRELITKALKRMIINWAYGVGASLDQYHVGSNGLAIGVYSSHRFGINGQYREYSAIFRVFDHSQPVAVMCFYEDKIRMHSGDHLDFEGIKSIEITYCDPGMLPKIIRYLDNIISHVNGLGFRPSVIPDTSMTR